jgi:hypothetical protein
MEVKRIAPEQAKELLDSNQGYIYLGVRTVPEFEAGHVPGAKNVPVVEPDASGRMQLNPRWAVWRRPSPCETYGVAASNSSDRLKTIPFPNGPRSVQRRKRLGDFCGDPSCISPNGGTTQITSIQVANSLDEKGLQVFRLPSNKSAKSSENVF